MRQLTTPRQIVDLSPLAREKLNNWLKEKEYGADIDGEFVPMTQLSIGQMIEFLQEYLENPVTIMVWEKMARVETRGSSELCDALFDSLKTVLEQRN